eukprot:TRINITY_DN6950_c0_g1_i5.p1 TRINITY_DN6950_c0_g1~~TRINITY_DN6950_c0_g1_i5.p1  ORF type:complete len:456 (-),score=75.48 TRINITY_DN6950_c0_g1_i5:234-1601(-)
MDKLKDPLVDSWKDSFLIGSLAPHEMCAIYAEVVPPCVILPGDLRKHQPGKDTSAPIQDLKTASWVQLVRAPTSVQPLVPPVVEEVPLENKKKVERILATINISLEPYSVNPRGLNNPDNKCFMNSVLQALVACSPFCRLLSDFSEAYIDKNKYPYLHLLVTFKSHFREFKENGNQRIGIGLPFLPDFFYPTLVEFNRKEVNFQEDAEEYLSFLLDKLHEEFSKMKQSNLKPQKPKRAVLSSSSEDEWLEVKARNRITVVAKTEVERTPIHAIFGGSLQSTLNKKGMHTSTNVEPFLCLHLDIHDDSIVSLDTAMRMFTSQEDIEGFVGKVGREIPVRKQIKFDELPFILIVHLKRFMCTPNGIKKIYKNISYPPILSIHNHWGRPNLSGSRSYSLFAVVSHVGMETRGGHYKCDTYHHETKQWFNFNDFEVTRVTSEKVLNNTNAYLLFYQKGD